MLSDLLLYRVKSNLIGHHQLHTSLGGIEILVFRLTAYYLHKLVKEWGKKLAIGWGALCLFN